MRGGVVTAMIVSALVACTAEPTAGPSEDAPTAPPSETRRDWTPTGELVYGSLPADRGDAFVLARLHTVRADGSGDTTLALSATGAEWSADGNRLLASGVRSHPGRWRFRPAVVDLTGRPLWRLRLPDLGDEVANCHGTPDEEAIVCDASGVRRINLATERSTRLTRGSDQAWDVSPAGRIAVAHQPSGHDGLEDIELWTMELDGTDRRRLTTYGELAGVYDDDGGSWLPDGSAIVAATPDGDLVKVDATSGDLTEIPLDEDLFASRPSVSPDGTMIAFEARGDGQDIHVTPIDGGPVHLVTGTGADEVRPRWRPTPRDEVFAACPFNLGDEWFGGACIGALRVGTNRSNHFTPAFSVRIAEPGWHNVRDLPEHYTLLPPGHVVAGIPAGTSDDIFLVQSVFALEGCSSRKQLTNRPRRGVARTAETIARELSTRPGVLASASTSVTIGGLSGYVVDLAIDPGWTGTCIFSKGVPTVPTIGGIHPSEVVSSLQSGFSYRYYFLDHDAGTLAVEVQDVAPHDLAAYDAIVRSLRFERLGHR